MRIKNRIKIVHTLQSIGVIGNMNFWIRKYCGNDDIVIIIDGDDKIIGRQGLKLLNSVYSTSNIWFAYSNFIVAKNGIKFASGAASRYLD